ncbi:MAG: hypothetical protein JST16_03200 [Bdellovibrionales bacterium]|nr:hypothetical protein [Bdellovibrionales bacterium]
MSDRWEIKPRGDIPAGTPIFVTLESGPGATSFQVSDNRGQHFDVELVPVESSPGHYAGEFSLSVPGDYRMSFRDLTASLRVIEKQTLSFGVEFGIFSSVVFILVGGMVLWLKRRPVNR